MPKSVTYSDEITFWLNGAGSRRILSQEEVLIISRRIQSEKVGSPGYRKAVNKLVSHNLRLVVRSVHLFLKTKSRREWGGSETLDFLQAGTLGLIRAAEKFDPTLGYTFATYATYWIRSFIGRYGIKTSSVFYIPETACRDAYSFEKHGFIRNKGYEDSLKLTKMVRAAQSPLSLDLSMNESGSTALLDAIESKYPNINEASFGFSSEITELMKRAKLSKNQVQILEYVFIDELKINEIMQMTDMTRNQICRIKKVALEKLKKVMSPV